MQKIINNHLLKGKAYIIPTVISEGQLDAIPAQVTEIIHSTRHYVVERARTARRFIKSTNPPFAIDSLQIIEIETKDGQKYDYQEICELLDAGNNVGILSESGCPGIADPGTDLVKQLQASKYEVVPLTGPSSIMLSLMASGMNGQQFEFHGYLPIQEAELKQKLQQLEKNALHKSATQIFIETPYRNDRLFKIMCGVLQAKTLLCVATDITGQAESIITQPIAAWKKSDLVIGKLPTVFLINK